MGKRVSSASLKHRLVDRGWAVVGVKDRKALETVRDALKKKARDLTGQPSVELEDFHHYVKDDATFERWVAELNRFFQTEKWGHRVIEAERDFFQGLLGPDLNVQAISELSIARPGCPKDNIAFRRDTKHGHLPHEISVLIPYVDVAEASAISVVSESHVRPEASELQGAEPVSMKFGEILLFSQALLYGSQANVGENTRWTSGSRVVNSGVAVSPDEPRGYYQNFCRSDDPPLREETP